MAVDLRRGNDVVQRLVDTADVFILSLRPGLADELGLGADELRARKPGAGPLHDLAVRPTGPEGEPAGLRPAASGRRRADLGHRRARRPGVRVGVSLIDHTTGMYAAFAILAALHAGGGATLDVSLWETALRSSRTT